MPHRGQVCRLRDYISYLDPTSILNTSPTPVTTAIKANILHTFGAQVESKLLKGGLYRV